MAHAFPRQCVDSVSALRLDADTIRGMKSNRSRKLHSQCRIKALNNVSSELPHIITHLPPPAILPHPRLGAREFVQRVGEVGSSDDLGERGARAGGDVAGLLRTQTHFAGRVA